MARWSLGGLVLVAGLIASLAGIVSGQSVQIGVMAPEVAQGLWINSEPLTLSALRGRVVLVEFWTYG